MNDFIVRLQNERNELANKLEKLNTFIGTFNFDKVDDVQKGLLVVQAMAMETYLSCLDQRLKRL